MRPNTRVAAAANPLPVPLSLAGNISGEMAYSTPYMIWINLDVSSSLVVGFWKGDYYIAEERVSTIPPQQGVGASGGCRGEKEDAR